MLNTKTLLMAAGLAVAALAGAAPADAAPWNHGRHHGPAAQRPVVERVRIVNNLRFNHYRVVGDHYWVRDRYVVRTYNRFGQVVFVQVNPWSGAFIREVIL